MDRETFIKAKELDDSISFFKTKLRSISSFRKKMDEMNHDEERLVIDILIEDSDGNRASKIECSSQVEIVEFINSYEKKIEETKLENIRKLDEL